MSEANAPGNAGRFHGIGTAPPRPAVPLASELGGDLPCVRCRYNLRGLSIRGVCPECGTPVKATLLAVVDPLANELRPISTPHLVGTGVVVWSTLGLLAAISAWGARLAERASNNSMHDVQHWLALATCVFAAMSGLGAMALIKPHAGISRRSSLLAAVAVALYIPVCVLLFRIYVGGDGRPGAQLAMHALLTAIVLGLRPNARILAARSLLMRTGRVDRQTMLALAGVLCVSLAGNCVRLASGQFNNHSGETVAQVGGIMVLVGMLLFTVGLVGVVVDCWRLRPVIVEAPLSLSQLLGAGTARPRVEQPG